MRYFLIDEKQLGHLASMARRFFAEDRMTGDALRDAAQTIDHIVTVCRELPAPDEIGA